MPKVLFDIFWCTKSIGDYFNYSTFYPNCQWIKTGNRRQGGVGQRLLVMVSSSNLIDPVILWQNWTSFKCKKFEIFFESSQM